MDVFVPFVVAEIISVVIFSMAMVFVTSRKFKSSAIVRGVYLDSPLKRDTLTSPTKEIHENISPSLYENENRSEETACHKKPRKHRGIVSLVSLYKPQ